MLNKVKSLTFQSQTTKNKLLKILREEARKLNLLDMVRCSLQIQQAAECIHTSYKNEYIKAETAFMIRIREVKEDNLLYSGKMDVEELNTAIDILSQQEKLGENMQEADTGFLRIYSILSLYTTFIRDEPIHQVGSLFPGGFKVKKEGDKYTCPVKDNNDNNPLAVCPFCIAEQDEEV